MSVTRPGRWLFPAVIAAGIAVASSLALAGPVANLATAVAHVSIIVPPVEDPILVEAISRLRSELRVVGLDSQSLGCDAEGAQDARACADSPLRRPVDSAAEQTAPRTPGVATALISLAREDGVVTIEVIERLGDGSKFFRLVYVPVREGGGDPSVLAVRSVELLRDVHLDVERSETAPKPVEAPSPVVVEAPVVTSSPSIEPGPWRIGVTIGLLQGRNGLGPRPAPALGVARALTAHLVAMATVTGPYYQGLTSAGDTAATRQEFALVGVRGELGTGRLRPFGTVAVGAFHMVASGSSSAPMAVTRDSSLWAVLGAAGAGGAFKVGRFIDLVADAELLLAGPAGDVTIRNVVVGTAGAPSVLFQAGLWISLP
ncbi:MAG TPA: hypothetical protein VGP07_08155 [Polyangia bacterium]